MQKYIEGSWGLNWELGKEGKGDTCKEASVLFTSTESAPLSFCISLFVRFVAVCAIVLNLGRGS